MTEAMNEFFTREQANEGNQLPLVKPNGSPSEHWIRVRGVDSDHFRKAESNAKRKAVEIAQIDDTDARAALIRKIEIECIAALISGWSFPQECTMENICSFLHEAPQIADMVNRYAAQRSVFFTKKPNSSANGSKPRSNSRAPRKGRKSNSATT